MIGFKNRVNCGPFALLPRIRAIAISIAFVFGLSDERFGSPRRERTGDHWKGGTPCGGASGWYAWFSNLAMQPEV
jgi:hypothetical protein